MDILEKCSLGRDQQIVISYAELEERLEQEKQDRRKENSEKDKKIGQLHVVYIIIIAIIIIFSFISHHVFSIWVKIVFVGVVFLILAIIAKYHNDTYSSEIFKFLGMKFCSRGDTNPLP